MSESQYIPDPDELEDDAAGEQDELYEHYSITADRGQSPLRLDKFLTIHMERCSRNRIQTAADAGNILVNGKPAKSSYKVKPLDRIQIVMPYPRREVEIIPEDIPLEIPYEDDDLLIVNKRCGDLVQPDPSGGSALEDQIKAFIKRRDAKPGEVFLGVVHRIDRPVSGAVLFAKTSKALTRLNEMIREGRIRKIYWALTEQAPDPLSGELCHYILRDGRANRSRACDAPKADAKQARLRYATLGAGTHYTLVEVELLTGRHHQIRAQLSKIGCPIRGDLKYGARRSLPGGGISLHSRSVEFEHPVRHEPVAVTAPVPADDNLWAYFENR